LYFIGSTSQFDRAGEPIRFRLRTTFQAYFAAAALFAAIGTIILVIVGATYRDGAKIERPLPASVRDLLLSLVRNRAFVTLSAAMMAMIVAITVINKSVLYYFKYLLNDPDAGQVALAEMGLVSGVAIPLWMLVGRRVGLRAVWLISSGLGSAGLVVFASVPLGGVRTMQLFLMGMQVVSVALNFVFWAMLPNTIEYGERATGHHLEGTVFGVAALLQRIAIGIATAILGWGFALADYVPNVQQTPATLASMRMTVALAPLMFLALSCVAMALNPLGRRSTQAPEVAGVA